MKEKEDKKIEIEKENSNIERNEIIDMHNIKLDNDTLDILNKIFKKSKIDNSQFIPILQKNSEDDIVIGKLSSNKDNKVLFNPPLSGRISMYYLYSATVPHQSSFIRTELLRQFPYDEDLKIVSDWKFFVQAIIMNNCSVKYIDDYVATFDLEGVSTSNPDKMWKEKEKVLSNMFPPRVLEDYKTMKASECLTQTLTPQLRCHYRIDRFLYRLGKMILKLTKN